MKKEYALKKLKKRSGKVKIDPNAANVVILDQDKKFLETTKKAFKKRMHAMDKLK